MRVIAGALLLLCASSVDARADDWLGSWEVYRSAYRAASKAVRSMQIGSVTPAFHGRTRAAPC